MEKPAKDTSVDSRYEVPNLKRALAIMELLARHPRGLGLTEIAGELGLSKNSIFRITRTLLNTDYLHRDPDSKRLILTRKLLALGYAAVSEYNLVEKALDIMRQLRNEVKETVLLGVMLDDEGIVLEQVPGSHMFKFLVDIGMRYSLHVAAPGKAMMAYLPEQEREELVSRLKMKRYNANTITSRRVLLEELEMVLECGYAVDRAEELEGVHCLSAPVLDQYGSPVAAIWITGPSDRLPVSKFEEIGKTIRKHADRISWRLGHGIV